jgi:hypothetical protein
VGADRPAVAFPGECCFPVIYFVREIFILSEFQGQHWLPAATDWFTAAGLGLRDGEQVLAGFEY